MKKGKEKQCNVNDYFLIHQVAGKQVAFFLYQQNLYMQIPFLIKIFLKGEKVIYDKVIYFQFLTGNNDD